MKKSSTTTNNNVTRKHDLVSYVVIFVAILAFIGVCALTIADAKSQATTVYAEESIPYDTIKSTETIAFQKSYDKKNDTWKLYYANVFIYEYDGVPGVFIICDELEKSMDFYGFSCYTVLNTYDKYGENGKDNPAFNLIIQKSKDDKNGIYIHPEEETGTFMIVQNIQQDDPE